MDMTPRQIRGALLSHERRVRQLREWYEDSHPIIRWHLQQMEQLRERERSQG